MNIGWRTKYILALSEDFLIHRWKLSGTMGLAHGFQFHKKASNIPPEGMLLAFCTDIYLFLLTVLENILDRPQIFGIAQRHHVFDIRAEKSDVLQSFQLFFLQCHHK